jgi:hypothetical protein
MSGLTGGAAMKLIIGNTEIDFSTISNSDLVFNKSVEIPLQDLHDTAFMLRNDPEDTVDLWERVKASEEKIGELESENEQHAGIVIEALKLIESLINEKNQTKFLNFLDYIDCRDTGNPRVMELIRQIQDKLNSYED